MPWSMRYNKVFYFWGLKILQIDQTYKFSEINFTKQLNDLLIKVIIDQIFNRIKFTVF